MIIISDYIAHETPLKYKFKLTNNVNLSEDRLILLIHIVDKLKLDNLINQIKDIIILKNIKIHYPNLGTMTIFKKSLDDNIPNILNDEELLSFLNDEIPKYSTKYIELKLKYCNVNHTNNTNFFNNTNNIYNKNTEINIQCANCHCNYNVSLYNIVNKYIYNCNDCIKKNKKYSKKIVNQILEITQKIN